VNGKDNKHIAQSVTGWVQKWITKMTTEHLPARLGWVAYKFKLRPGIHYGLATLAMSLKTANTMLGQENLWLLSFLGINQNVKREWRTLHWAFRGIWLFSLAVEHTIATLNMIVQHYRAGTTLTMKFSASLEALQLEIGCAGKPLEEDYGNIHYLAMQRWVEIFWERLHHYQFVMHQEYKRLDLPKQSGAQLFEIVWRVGFKKVATSGT
jgi:hypothetical protein